MIDRCENPSSHAFRYYGARGIRLSEEWRRSFSSFYRDMGPRPSTQHSIDRIDNDKGYSKENCRWALSKEQSRNRRHTTKPEVVTQIKAEIKKDPLQWANRIATKYGVTRRIVIGIRTGKTWKEE